MRRTLRLASSAALETGRVLDRAIGGGAAPDFEDAAIAATAAVHGLTVVTVNERHFKYLASLSSLRQQGERQDQELPRDLDTRNCPWLRYRAKS
jgi:predicted nucleic acid-binding protein